MRSPRSTRCLNYLRDGGQSTSDVAEYRKKSRLKSGKNPEPIRKSVRLCNTENQCLSRSWIRLDDSQASPTMRKKSRRTRGKKSSRQAGKTDSQAGALMAKSTLGKAVLVATLLASVTPAAAQEAQPTTPSPASPSQNGTTTTPTPAPNATAPTPAPGETQLPTVQVIQKEQKTPANEQKKTVAAKKAPVTLPPVTPAASTSPVTPQVPGTGGIDDGTVLMSPVEGSAIPIGKYPGRRRSGVRLRHRALGHHLRAEHLQQTVPGAILGDAQGNGFQRICSTAASNSSPVNGVPQGLAVYQNGVRINESFGDIVNWDFLPDNAIDGHHHRRRQPGLRSQRARRRGDGRDARRLQLPGRRDRQPRRLVRPRPG